MERCAKRILFFELCVRPKAIKRCGRNTWTIYETGAGNHWACLLISWKSRSPYHLWRTKRFKGKRHNDAKEKTQSQGRKKMRIPCSFPKSCSTYHSKFPPSLCSVTKSCSTHHSEFPPYSCSIPKSYVQHAIQNSRHPDAVTAYQFKWLRWKFWWVGLASRCKCFELS